MTRCRRAVAADQAGLVSCIEAAYAPYLKQGLTLPPVSEGIGDDIHNHHVWVAVDDGPILGGMILILDDAAHLTNLAVHPDASGQGIGKALVALAADASRHAGYDRLGLATHAEMPRTLAFYQNLGWTKVGQDGDKVYLELEL